LKNRVEGLRAFHWPDKRLWAWIITRIGLVGLAQLVGATNRLAEAAPLYRRAPAIDERFFGPDHPHVALRLDNLAGLLIDSGLKGPHPRLMLIGRFGFTKSAVEAARNLDPITVDLLDLNDIDRWITRVESEKPDNAAKFQALIRSFSHEYAKAVAADPEMLEQALQAFEMDTERPAIVFYAFDLL
jgi:hypothetical protein